MPLRSFEISSNSSNNFAAFTFNSDISFNEGLSSAILISNNSLTDSTIAGINLLSL